MQRFHKLFDVKKGCQVLGMIHVEALPGKLHNFLFNF